MAKKERTPEQIAADKARMAKVRAARNKKPKEEGPKAPVGETVAAEDYKALLKRIEELEQKGYPQTQTPQVTNVPQVTSRGVVGTVEKYPTNPKLYPDPRERLAKEPRLKRFAFEENYELEWKVNVSSYETIDGVRTKEPKFTLQLNRIVFDDNGEETDGRYVIGRIIMHEDPDSALEVARLNGVDVPEDAEMDFLNEMRYLQMRDWVFDAFYPHSVDETAKKKDMVVDGQVVEFFTVNSEKSSKIPFGELDSKLRT